MTSETTTANPVMVIRERMAETILSVAASANITSLERLTVYTALREWSLVNERTNDAAEQVCTAAQRTPAQRELLKKFTEVVCADLDSMWRVLCRKCGRDPLVESILLFGLDMTDWKKTADRHPGYQQVFRRVFLGEPAIPMHKNGPR